MKNKFLKSIASVVAVVMLLSMVPAVVSADAAISGVKVEINKNDNGDKIVTVTAAVSGLTEYTLLAVRDNKAYTALSDIPSDEVAADATMSPLEKQVEYIDQPTVDGDTISFEFPLRDREDDLAMAAADCYINVFLGGAGAEAVVANAIELLDAPAIAVEDPADKYYVEGENVVVTYDFGENADAEALWEAKTLDVKIGDEVLEDVAWDFAGNNVKIPAASFDAASYTDAVITIAETENATFYAATAAAVTFTVASRVEEAKAAVPATLEQVPNADDTAVEITIPANTEVAGVAIAYELVTTGYDVVDNKITVTRPDEDADPIEIEVKATLTYGELVIDPISIKTSVRPAGAAIEPENVTILKASGAYGDSSKALVKVVVDATVVDPATDSITGLYYSEAKGAFYGIVDKAIATDAETLAEALSDAIVATPAEQLKFGVAYPGNAAMNSNDVFYAMRIFQRKTTQADKDALSDKVYLSYDVSTVELDGTLNSNDVFDMMRTFQRKQPALTVHTSAE